MSFHIILNNVKTAISSSTSNGNIRPWLPITAIYYSEIVLKVHHAVLKS